MPATERAAILAEFRALPHERRWFALALACRDLLAIWERYAAATGPMRYVESVVGTAQEIDAGLPRRALAEVDRRLAGELVDSTETAKAYWEPTIALRDDDVGFDGPALPAYYAIYNLHGVVFPRPGFSDDLERVILDQYVSALGHLDTDDVVREWWLRVWDAWASHTRGHAR